MGIRKVDTELCNGCGTCVRYCPMDVLRLNSKTKKAVIQYLRDCQGCFLCEMECPQKAIDCFPVRERRLPITW